MDTTIFPSALEGRPPGLVIDSTRSGGAPTSIQMFTQRPLSPKLTEGWRIPEAVRLRSSEP